MGHYIYKYVYQNSIIYIGKCDSILRKRIYQHGRETLFQRYKDAEIFYAEFDTAYLSEAFETFLINKYKPILNKDKTNSSMNFSFEEPTWIRYVEDFEQNDQKEISKIVKSMRKECANKVFYTQVYHSIQQQEVGEFTCVAKMYAQELQLLDYPAICILNDADDEIKRKIKYNFDIQKISQDSVHKITTVGISGALEQKIQGICLLDAITHLKEYGINPIVSVKNCKRS